MKNEYSLFWRLLKNRYQISSIRALGCGTTIYNPPSPGCELSRSAPIMKCCMTWVNKGFSSKEVENRHAEPFHVESNTSLITSDLAGSSSYFFYWTNFLERDIGRSPFFFDGKSLGSSLESSVRGWPEWASPTQTIQTKYFQLQNYSFKMNNLSLIIFFIF